MFGFFAKRRELANARRCIGVELHRQIRDALFADELLATRNLSSTFTAGYIYAFVRDGFASQGVEIGQALEDQIEHICEGVIPGKLYGIYDRQASLFKLAQSMRDQDREVLDSGLRPSDVVRRLADGAKAGTHDAVLVSTTATGGPDNLRRYLLGSPLSI